MFYPYSLTRNFAVKKENRVPVVIKTIIEVKTSKKFTLTGNGNPPPGIVIKLNFSCRIQIPSPSNTPKKMPDPEIKMPSKKNIEKTLFFVIPILLSTLILSFFSK